VTEAKEWGLSQREEEASSKVQTRGRERRGSIVRQACYEKRGSRCDLAD